MIDPYFIAMSAFTVAAVIAAIAINYFYNRSRRSQRTRHE